MQAFQRWVLPVLGAPPRVLALPSTSPANAGWSFERKLTAWQDVFRLYGLMDDRKDLAPAPRA